MHWVSIKQCKYFMQVIKQNQLPYLLNEEKKVVDTVYKLIRDNWLYNEVGKIIEDEANRIVREECEPEWTRISGEMQELNKEKTELEKKVEEAKKNEETIDEEVTKRIQEIIVLLSQKSDESSKVGTDANIRLNNFKDELIDNKYKTTYCFDMHDKDYELINRITWWSVYDWETEWNVVAPK